MSTSSGSWGRDEHLNGDMKVALASFIEKVSLANLERVRYTAESQDMVALRFLRARKFDVDKALVLLTECNEMFDKYDADGCAAMGEEAAAGCDPDVLTTFYPHTQWRYDKEGRLLLWEANGCVNLHALETVVRRENLIKYHFWTMLTRLNELFSEGVANAAGEKTVWTTAVLDFEGLSMHHFSSKMFTHLKTMVAIDNVCFPEMLGKLVVLNAPALATTGWKMIKGWLDPRTQEKIELLSSGEPSRKRLLELVDADSVPRSLGGKAEEVFTTKPNTEYLCVPRGGKIDRGVVVPKGKSFVIDTYVRDDCTTLSVTSFPVPDTYKHAWSSGDAFPIHESTEVVTDAKLTTDKKDESGRNIVKVDAVADTNRLIRVCYKNLSSWYARYIVTSCTIIDTDGVPLYKKDGSITRGKLDLSAQASDAGDAEPVPPSVFGAVSD